MKQKNQKIEQNYGTHRNGKAPSELEISHSIVPKSFDEQFIWDSAKFKNKIYI